MDDRERLEEIDNRYMCHWIGGIDDVRIDMDITWLVETLKKYMEKMDFVQLTFDKCGWIFEKGLPAGPVQKE